MEEKEIWKIWKETYCRRWGHITWQISNLGNVMKNGLPYECRLNCNGYKVFGSGWLVHRAVTTLFIPNINNYNEVDHINGNKLDNQACNLRWCTHKENLNNPNYKKRMSEAQNKPETRRKKSEGMKSKNYPMY